jgi:hypothetical protein
MKNLIKVLVMIPCLLFLVNCSKSSKGNNNANCYQQSQYGQTFYNPACNNVNGGMPGYPPNGGYGQACNGMNYYYQGQQVCCGTVCIQTFGYAGNCAGYTLQTQSGQTVRCQ